MFEAGVTTTVILTAVALWFAHGWYLNTRLLAVHKKLDTVLHALDGLRTYLYEIDPQFDDERRSRGAFESGESMFAGAEDMEVMRRKRAEGRRTLDTTFLD